MKDNLKFWESVEKTNPIHTKKAKSGGRTLTAINAQQQIKNATSEWGMYGKTWGLRDIKLDYKTNLVHDQVLAIAQGVFFYPEGEFEIGSSILVQQYYASKKYSAVDDDFLKKLETDMTTKALSKLGFNADVFLGYYDDNKYIAKMKENFSELPQLKLGTPEFKTVKEAIKSGKATIEYAKSKYNISDTILKQLQ